MKSFLRLLFILPVAVFICQPTSYLFANTNRLALAIGNSAYENAPLKNPVNDAIDMAAILKRLGFKVTLKTNANLRSMHDAINTFGKQLRGGGVGLFYYAGHGLQVQGHNYLIPIGATIESESDVRYEGVDAGRVLGKMEDAGNGLNIIILDACRNNPYSRSFRSSTSGLAKMDAPAGSILAFSTAPGSVAADGQGRNGLYTSKLLKHMATKGLTLEKMFKKVRIEVTRASDRKQIPWESSSLLRDFHFSPDTQKAPRPVRAIDVKERQIPQHLNAEEEMWEIVKTSESIEDYNTFLDEYPNSRFRGAARLKIQQLKRKKIAQPMTASIAPIDTGRKSEKSTSSKPSTNYKYSIAIFPSDSSTNNEIYCSNAHEMVYKSAFTAITEFTNRQPNFALRHSYYPGFSSADKELVRRRSISVIDDMIDNEVSGKLWRRKSAFSSLEPDISTVSKIAKKINADMIVMYRYGWLYYSDDRKQFSVYLVDVKREKMYVASAADEMNYAGKKLEELTNSLLEDFQKIQTKD